MIFSAMVTFQMLQLQTTAKVMGDNVIIFQNKATDKKNLIFAKWYDISPSLHRVLVYGKEVVKATHPC
jgi:hypothetical protein